MAAERRIHTGSERVTLAELAADECAAFWRRLRTFPHARSRA